MTCNTTPAIETIKTKPTSNIMQTIYLHDRDYMYLANQMASAFGKQNIKVDS